MTITPVEVLSLIVIFLKPKVYILIILKIILNTLLAALLLHLHNKD